MNVAELPMILFTVIAQMCIGAFIVLGVIHVVASVKHGDTVVNKLTDPALYAIGPALVLGLAVSTLHMHDISHTLNVLRHWQTSWLSREIIFGCGFAGMGFLFAITQWFKWGSLRIRQVLAGLAAVFGICLLVAMSMIYYSVETIPAWHTWTVPAMFTGTTVLLGSLSIGTALMAVVKWRTRKGHTISADEWTIMGRALRGIAITSAVAGVIMLILYPIHIANITDPVVGAVSRGAFSGPVFVVRLVLLAVASVILALFTFRTVSTAESLEGKKSTLLTWLISVAFVVAFVGELLGRSLHYESMFRVGI